MWDPSSQCSALSSSSLLPRSWSDASSRSARSTAPQQRTTHARRAFRFVKVGLPLGGCSFRTTRLSLGLPDSFVLLFSGIVCRSPSVRRLSRVLCPCPFVITE